MNSYTQKMMLSAIVIVVLGIGASVYLSDVIEDPGSGPASSDWQPGNPKVEQVQGDGIVPTWTVSGIFENGKESRRWGRAELVWANGERMEWKGEPTLERTQMCGFSVEYFYGQESAPSLTKSEDIVQGECQPATIINFTSLLSEVLGDPLNHSVPYAAFDGYEIQIVDGSGQMRSVSPIQFGLELRLSFMRNSPLSLVSSDAEIRQNNAIRFR